MKRKLFKQPCFWCFVCLFVTIVIGIAVLPSPEVTSQRVRNSNNRRSVDISVRDGRTLYSRVSSCISPAGRS